ncbi:hypothetical protein K1T73_11010 [Roseovarius sp. SCSIO 43702]|nr:hypothetical protein K1T73_11010 [Roseovarius sp. SCSIO 43702]
MEGYVGKSITAPMLDYGKPTSVFDLPDGRRAFQWRIDESGYIPMSNPSTTSLYGANGWTSVTTTSTDYVPYSQSCLYTLFGKPKGKDWIVVGFKKPSWVCE